MNNESLEAAKCPLHPEAKLAHRFYKRDEWFGSEDEFGWNQCVECGTYVLSPRPTTEKIIDYYPDNYNAYSKAVHLEKNPVMRWKRRRNLMPKVKGIQAFKNTGRILDVGCATGNFLYEMGQQKWETVGVELSETAVKYGREVNQLEIYHGDLLDVILPSDKFDVITLWDVVEHLFFPLEVMKKVHSYLKPDGLVVFSIPDPQAIEEQIFGKSWIGYDTPRHLYLFHGVGLNDMLRQCGFELVKTEHKLGTYHTWRASFLAYENSRGRASWFNRVSHWPFWSILASPIFNVINRLGRGTVLVVYAKPLST